MLTCYISCRSRRKEDKHDVVHLTMCVRGGKVGEKKKKSVDGLTSILSTDFTIVPINDT